MQGIVISFIPLRAKNKSEDIVASVIEKLDKAIIELSESYNDLIQLASDVPDINETFARYIIAEIGADMTIFKSAEHPSLLLCRTYPSE